MDSFPRQRTPVGRPADIYEIRQTGPYNYLVQGGGEQIWTDGIRPDDGHLLEAKHVADVRRSPYVEDSAVPPFVRQAIRKELDEEFRRYAAVIADPDNSFEGLEVITNADEAVPFFQDLLARHSIPGRVVVRA